MNKTCILNFLNEFRELFDQDMPSRTSSKLRALDHNPEKEAHTVQQPIEK